MKVEYKILLILGFLLGIAGGYFCGLYKGQYKILREMAAPNAYPPVDIRENQ